jgi:AcrR family transcriptional regulator
MMGETERTDRRSRRTRRFIAQALIALMLEERYDRITVQDIIDRADVGRSTFYAHYRDKEDVLIKESERMIALLYAEIEPDGAGDQLLLPSLGLFRHVEQMHREYQALFRGRFLEVFYSTAHRYLTASVERRLAAAAEDDVEGDMPLPILADFVVGTFLHLMRWWLEHERPYPPEHMDEILERLVLPGVKAALR